MSFIFCVILIVTNLLGGIPNVNDVTRDPINDPYQAAIVAAELTGLNDVVIGPGKDGKHGTAWLVATGITGSRLLDLRKRKTGPYAGTAIHKVDAWAGASNYSYAVSKGWLDPKHCIHHYDDGTRRGKGRLRYDSWSTRGPYEAMIHNKMHLLPIKCFPVEWMDIPLINAVAVSLYAKATCRRHRRRNQYNNRGIRQRCDYKFLRCIWAGIGKCNDSKFKATLHRKFGNRIIQARKLMRQRDDLP